MERTPETLDIPDNTQTTGESLVDFSPLAKNRKLFHQTMSVLKEAKNDGKFADDWNGGINSQHPVFLQDVTNLIIDLHNAKIPPHSLSNNERLAVISALETAGYKVAENLMTKLKNQAETEFPLSQLPQAVNSDTKSPRKFGNWGRRTVYTLPVILAAAAISKSCEVQNPNVNSPNGTGDPNAPYAEITPYAQPNSQEYFVQELDINSRPTIDQTPLPKSFSEIPKEQIPNVEGLNSNVSEFNLWGFNFNDPEDALMVVWDNQNVLNLNFGDSLVAAAKPNENAIGNTIATSCFTNPNVQCSIAFDNFIVYEGHSSISHGIELAMERLRSFLEGGVRVKIEEDKENGLMKVTRTSDTSLLLSPEEQRARISMLEENRPLLIQGEHQALAQVAIVRIEEFYSRTYLYNDWSTVVQEALRADPTISQRTNLNKPFAVLATCGWRQPGDERYPHNVSYYSSAEYLVFIGEAPQSDS